MATVTPDHDGPDISHWNPISNWDEIPPYDLWCMKATEGKGFKSPVFDTNWAKCRELNVKYLGAYHWIRSDSTMLQQVTNLKKALDAHGGLRDGEFVMLDWETTPGIKDVTVAQVNEWLERAEKVWPGRIIVYCSDWVPGFVEWRKANPDYPLWYANYNLGPSDRGGKAETDKWGADVWQWTSTADVPGFADDTIDMNDVLDWSWFETLYPGGTPTPEPPVEQPWPPFDPPRSYGLFPLDQNKPELRQTPARNNQSHWHVSYLQWVLKLECNRPRMTVDGWFGPQTEQAVREFQKYLGLTVDGWVGKQTWPWIDRVATD